MPKDFKLPDLGEGVHEGQILRVMVKVGDIVREDQPLMEVETDKAAVVIPSPFSGLVEEVHVSTGQLVHVGDVMVTIGDSMKHNPAAGPATPLTSKTEVTTRQAEDVQSDSRSPDSQPTASQSFVMPQSNFEVRRNPASPAVRKLARSLKLDIETIVGSGPSGRVQRTDLEKTAATSATPQTSLASVTKSKLTGPSARPTARERVASQPSLSLPGKTTAMVTDQLAHSVAARVAYPAVPESFVTEPPGESGRDSHGSIKVTSLSQARKTIATVMSQSWSAIPHATDFDDADVTELDKIRKGYQHADDPSQDRKLTMLAFVIRAVVRALQRFPEFNASIEIDKQQVVYKRYINIAVGVHTPRGLVPMVVRDADRMSIPQISDELYGISEKARTADFTVNETRGGTYTISNAGALGGSRYSTPLITPPQVAVLAIGKTKWMPWVVEQENGTRGIAPRLIMPLSHSIDHRLLDGGQEVQFMQHVIGDLQNPARLLL